MFHLSELQALASKFDPVSLAANEAERAVDAIVSHDVSRAKRGCAVPCPRTWVSQDGFGTKASLVSSSLSIYPRQRHGLSRRSSPVAPMGMRR